jgi:hypothetical protein
VMLLLFFALLSSVRFLFRLLLTSKRRILSKKLTLKSLGPCSMASISSVAQ